MKPTHKYKEYMCQVCRNKLEFKENEMQGLRRTGNGWFYCETCGETYFIEDYAGGQQ